MMTAPNGAPILTKSGLNSYKKMEIRRMNDGDVAFFDRDDPNCPPNTAIRDALWFTKSNIEEARQDWRERAGYPDGLWADIKYPWWSYTGF
jgi:hypothetical protein